MAGAVWFLVQGEKYKAAVGNWREKYHTLLQQHTERVLELQEEIREKNQQLQTLQTNNTEILATYIPEDYHQKQLNELKENHKRELVEIIDSLKSKYVTKDQVDQVENLLKELPKIVKEQIKSDVTGDTSALAQSTKNMLKQLDELRVSVSESSNKQEIWLRPIHNFTENFNNMLYNNRKRGKLGEITLANMLENAGLKRNVSYFEQVRTEESGQIVDFKIQLPEGQNIVIDSKFPLENWNAYLTATEEQKPIKMAAYVKDIQSHIRKLRAAQYHRLHRSSLNKTVMYLGIDEALNSAYEFDFNLKNYAEQNEVIILSPSSLLPFLELAHIIILANKRDQEVDRMIEIVQNIYNEAIKIHGGMQGLKRIVTSLVTELNTLRSDYNESFYPSLEELHELETLQAKRAKKLSKDSGKVTNLQLKPIASTRKPDSWESA